MKHNDRIRKAFELRTRDLRFVLKFYLSKKIYANSLLIDKRELHSTYL